MTESLLKPRYVPIVWALLLLAVVASRLVHLPAQVPDGDEVWSIWQTFGTPQQILNWTPYDWPPLYYLVLGGWKELVGIYPDVLRFLSLLVFLPGVVALYRAVGKMFDSNAGLLAAIAYAALGYSIFLSTILRGYGLLVALTPLLLWLTLNYFARPKLFRAVWLGVCMAAMFYTHMTAVAVFGLIGVYTLVVYRRQVWRWWMPGLIAAVLAAPQILSKISLVVSRTEALQKIVLPPPIEALTTIFKGYAGYEPARIAIWGVLFAAATVLIIVRGRSHTAQIIAVGLWLLSLVAIYLLNPILGLFNLRYLWWGLPGLAVWIGWGLSRLPRAGILAASAIMLVAMFWPINTTYALGGPPTTEIFQSLKKNLQGGDVVLIDPNCDTLAAEQWDYFTRVYFPQGLKYVGTPQGYRRVWYATKQGFTDAATETAVTKGRVPGMFVGPWNLLLRLYEAPPDDAGIVFENGMRFHGVDILDRAAPFAAVRHEGEPLRLRLWWSVDQPPTLNYSIGVYLMTANSATLLDQQNGQPKLARGEISTSQMQPGQFYLDERELTIPAPTTTGIYAVYLTVYDSANNTRVAAPGENNDKLLLIQQINVKSWSRP